MTGRRSKNEGTSEYFILAVDSWEFDYSFRVNVDFKLNDPLGLCSESCDVIVSGALRPKGPWGCVRASISLGSDGVEPQHWKPEWSAFGGVKGVKRGVLIGDVRLPASLFQSFMTALAAGKVRGLYVGVKDVARRAGRITTFFTTDPDEKDE